MTEVEIEGWPSQIGFALHILGRLAHVFGKFLLDHRVRLDAVGTAASLLGLSVEGAEGMRAVLIAIQTEPAVLVYGAIVFLLLVGFALLIPTSKWKKWITGH